MVFKSSNQESRNEKSGRGKPRKREMEKKDATDDPRSHRPPSLPRSAFSYSPARLCNSALTNQSAWREKGPASGPLRTALR